MEISAVSSSSAETNVVPRANPSPSVVVDLDIVVVVESFIPQLFTNDSSPPLSCHN